MSHKLLLSSIFWIAIAATGRAEFVPSFNLDRTVAQAAAVVHGKLDATGQLHVLEVLKGNFDKTIALKGGAEVFKQLQQDIVKERTFEVVVFLSEDGYKNWCLCYGSLGTVAFYKERVYLFAGNDKGRRFDHGFASLTDHKPAAYVAEVRQTLATFQERDRLLALPRGKERTAQVMAFLRTQPLESAYFHGWTLARSLEPADGKAILAELKKAERDPDRLILLELVRRVPLGKDAFEQVAGWTNATHSPAVRRAAFAALAAVDPYRMAGHYGLSLRNPDELQLDDLLHHLSGITHEHRHLPKHRNVVTGLVVLTGQVRHAHRERGRQAFLNESHALLGTLECYAHPRHLPLLLDWALADDHTTSNQALNTLHSITGLKHSRDERDAWNAWHKKAWPILSREYALDTDRGRTAWFEAYAQSDSATRRLLLTLWHYEEKVDEGSLVTAARGKLGDDAKTILADLWKVKRLSPAGKLDVLEHFLKVRLVELPLSYPKFPTIREMQIVVESAFPFPDDAWVDNRSSIVIGNNHVPKIEGSGGRFSLSNIRAGPYVAGSLGGGSYSGAPSARALLELSELDLQAGDRVVWKKLWTLGPIVLEKR